MGNGLLLVARFHADAMVPPWLPLLGEAFFFVVLFAVGGGYLIFRLRQAEQGMQNARTEWEEWLLGFARSERHRTLNELQLVGGWLQLGRAERAREQLLRLEERLKRFSEVGQWTPPALAAGIHLAASRAELQGVQVHLETGSIRVHLEEPALRGFLAALEDAVDAAGKTGDAQVQVRILEGPRGTVLHVQGGAEPVFFLLAAVRTGKGGVRTMFVDQAAIEVKAGNGGNGMVAFRREKYVPEGGPSGGDGGRGGDVVLEVDPSRHTLADFRYRHHYRAEPGENGRTKNQHGANGADLVVPVPPGTVVRLPDGRVLADLTQSGERVVVAKGGRGGRGNARFASAVNRVPRMVEKGEPGGEREIVLELRLLADVGLVGEPNAGKSTLLSRVTRARPKVADYPFTTLEPGLGVVEGSEGDGFVLADLPGLIEGAHAGVGLGHDFLRHISRTRVLLHVVDASGGAGEGDPLEAYQRVRRELELYDPALLERPQVVAANKVDVPAGQEGAKRLAEVLGPQGVEVHPISAATGEGIAPLLRAVEDLLQQTPAFPPLTLQEVQADLTDEEGMLSVRREGDRFVVEDRALERRMAMTDMNNDEAVRRLMLYMRRRGVEAAVRSAGGQDHDTVVVGGVEFELRSKEIQL